MKTLTTIYNKIPNKHAPFNERKIQPKQIPYIYKALKSAVYETKMLYNKLKKIMIKRTQMHKEYNEIMSPNYESNPLTTIS